MPKKEYEFQAVANFELWIHRLGEVINDLRAVTVSLELHKLDGLEVPFAKEFKSTYMTGVENFAANSKRALYTALESQGTFKGNAAGDDDPNERSLPK